MKADLDIHHVLPHLDLEHWEGILDEADRQANDLGQEVAVFFRPKTHQFRIGTKLHIHECIVHVSKPVPVAKAKRDNTLLLWACVATGVVVLGLWWTIESVVKTLNP